MKESKDIILKTGDIAHYINNYGEMSVFAVDGYNGYSLKEVKESGWLITKVERPVKYETIYEAPKPILDKEEKAYLEAVIKPFKTKVLCIKRCLSAFDCEFIYIRYKTQLITTTLPEYKRGTMYKGMKLNKEYTLDELGLFKEVVAKD